MREAAEAALRETSAALSAKHGLPEEELAAYREKILGRFSNPYLVDEVTRVGREPIRKLGRNDRFIGPASDYAEYVGGVPHALIAAIGAALRFDVPEDSQSVELQKLLDEADAAAIVEEVMGVEADRPLHEPLIRRGREGSAGRPRRVALAGRSDPAVAGSLGAGVAASLRAAASVRTARWYVSHVSRIVSVAPVLPARSYSQGEITAALLAMITSDPARQKVMRRIHASSGVQTRSLVMPLEQYSSLASFQESNDYFIAEGTSLAERALTAALDSAGLAPRDVDFLLFTSVTGIAAPSIDAQLVARLGLRPDVKRLPSFGLGCVAGAAGIARVNDYLAGHPDEVAVLLSVELCSLTVQARDDSMANIVASGLFGDGAAAVVMVGDDARRRRSGSPAPTSSTPAAASTRTRPT